ncbi:MAG TPA: alpha-2-macroglobulin family protein [Thermoanaerobaculia bacterium]|nr:alpha-2-macroglobulin family protein [Thermoanaerobaculia bacterium]
MKRVVVVAALLLLSSSILSAADTLRVISAGPVGEVASMAEANEVRVVFSEPMVVVGRIPQPVTAPFFRIEPAVKGTFRWSGTTTLIFTPEPLPYARQFNVTIDAGARSVAGNTLDRDYTFSFTTPTIRLLRTQWYRKGDEAGAPLVIGLRFNQAVDAQVVARHLQLRTIAHPFDAPQLPAATLEREAFEAKRVRAAATAAAGGERVLSFLTKEWDHKRIEPGTDLVVLETKPGILPETWLQVFLDEKLAASGRAVPSGRAQEYTIQLEPAFFVDRLSCVTRCDPEMGTYLEFRTQAGVRMAEARKAVSVTDLTDPLKPVKLTAGERTSEYDYPSNAYSLDTLGFELQPSRRYLVRVDSSLRAEDGQILGYVWMETLDVWHKSAFISFGEGQGVWESSGGAILPFHARNFRSVKQWLAPLSIEQTMPLLLEMMRNGFRSVPPDAPSKPRTLRVIPDKIQAFGLDASSVVGSDGRGLFWAAIEPGEAIPRSNIYDPMTRATIVQVTNLGISVKDSPLNTLILVTTLDEGKPVAGANVSIRTTKNDVFWRGVTGADGIAIAPNTNLREVKSSSPEPEYDESWRALGELHFIVVAEKDGDVAYVGSDWNEGITPWELGVNFDINEADPLLRGTVFSDRGVYKLGEEVHAKVVIRSDTPAAGMQLLPAGTRVEVLLRDSQNKDVIRETVTLNEWSSAEWVFRVPAEAPLGNYSMQAKVEGQRLAVHGGFLVAAYRRPDFRVDVTVDAPSTVAGTNVNGKIIGRYLYGGSMSNRDVRWKWTKRPVWDVPAAIRDRWPSDRFLFLGWNEDISNDPVTISSKEEQLDAKGELNLVLPTGKADGWPFDYQLEAEVADVTRQRIANRASFRTDPAEFYVGVKPPPYFAEAADGVATEIIVAGLDGLAVSGIPVEVKVERIQYNSVRRAVGNGFYEWETERKELPAGEWTITSQAAPVPLRIPLAEGGEYRLTARATDAGQRTTTTRTWFYAVGPGYTAWERYDHNRIDLVPERKKYKPGETARIMIKSPWERATALLTTEREGIRSHERFDLTSTQQTISVPITERDIPNVYVSVLLVKGRTQDATTEDTSDPGKPSFRLGYIELEVEDASKRLSVDVKANRDEFRPASKAQIDVNVRDVSGAPVQSEVTLWAVDYGVLSLTAYQTPDVLDSIYLKKALQVVNEDSRQRIISRRVLTPKGAGEGGGGGADAGPGTLRKDFRVLAFWIGSVITDARGHARTNVTLPESLTTYRIMAVAGDRASRFGWDAAEIRVNKPLMLTPAFPRFLSVSDNATVGAVVHNQSKRRGRVTVTVRSLDPAILAITGEQKRTLDVAAGGSELVRFGATANTVGTARLQMRVTMGRENDAFEDVVPVRILVSPETAAAYGEASPTARETVQIPAQVVPGFGGLKLELASTQLVGLAEGARYLVEYPYGCAEQRASTTLALMLVTDLGAAFSLPGIEPGRSRETAQASLHTLERFQCGDGGFAFWPGHCASVSPYLTSYVIHVFQRAQKLKYDVDADMLTRAYEYLDRSLGSERPPNEGWWPAFTSWQAFAVKVLAEGGRNVDSHVSRIYGYVDRMPVFGISFLADAMAAGRSDARLEDLHRRMRNAILPEGGLAHVEELSDPYLLWFWNSNVRSTAIVLGTFVRRGSDEELSKRMVRWLMRARKDGRWGNTQENAWAMASLVDYYRRYEAEVPNFASTVALGPETIASDEFRGRSTEVKSREFSMQQVLAKAPAGQTLPVVFERQGTGTLFYMMRLRYASLERNLQPMNNGFQIERTYETVGDAPTPSASFTAGQLIRVTLKIRNTKERRFVAVTDPIPAGTEPVETAFATTASDLVEQSRNDRMYDWTSWYRRGGWDHEERHDDRVNAFATRLAEGEHTYSYLLRATTVGTFLVAPAHVEEMYEPEVFGRAESRTVQVTP